MFQVNEYFDGKVKSISFQTDEGPASVGVMAPGEFAFKTSKVEYMTVTSGLMTVLLPGETEWRDYRDFETFRVDRNQEFQVKVLEETSYRCLYK